jgi:hypothetical protein
MATDGTLDMLIGCMSLQSSCRTEDYNDAPTSRGHPCHGRPAIGVNNEERRIGPRTTQKFEK